MYDVVNRLFDLLASGQCNNKDRKQTQKKKKNPKHCNTVSFERLFLCLFCRRESDSVVGEVELSVIRADEDVAKNPQRTGRRRQVNAHEARQAQSLTRLRHAQHVLLRRQLEALSSQAEGDDRHGRDSRAVDDVLSGGDRSGTDSFLNGCHFFHWTRDERSAGVSDGLTSSFAEGVARDAHAIHLELPVTLTSDVDVCELTLIVTWVRASKNDFSTRGRRRISVKIEAEDIGRHDSLGCHVVEDGRDSVDGDGGISHPEDAVEFGGDKSESRLVRRLGESLSVDAQGADRHCVSGQKA